MRDPITGVKFRILAFAALAGLLACGKSTERKVHFEKPEDGASLESPFPVSMKAENLIVEPAAKGVTDGHGHFHIIIDAPAPEAPMPVGKDAQHIHYGTGDSETTLDLPPGEHTLILQFAKGDHVPYSPQISEEIHVRVTKQNTPPPAAGSKADSAKSP